LAPEALIGQLSGRKFGKLLVRVTLSLIWINAKRRALLFLGLRSGSLR